MTKENLDGKSQLLNELMRDPKIARGIVIVSNAKEEARKVGVDTNGEVAHGIVQEVMRRTGSTENA